VIFHGKRGELRQRYRDGQEDQLGSLGLVVNVIVLWNTIYIGAALNQLRAEGYEVKPEDVTHLSPLSFAHINMLGRYAFTLPEIIARGELRPLRDPRTAGIDDLQESLCVLSVPLLQSPCRIERLPIVLDTEPARRMNI
jgi:hypothetical protein